MAIFGKKKHRRIVDDLRAQVFKRLNTQAYPAPNSQQAPLHQDHTRIQEWGEVVAFQAFSDPLYADDFSHMANATEHVTLESNPTTPTTTTSLDDFPSLRKIDLVCRAGADTSIRASVLQDAGRGSHSRQPARLPVIPFKNIPRFNYDESSDEETPGYNTTRRYSSNRETPVLDMLGSQAPMQLPKTPFQHNSDTILPPAVHAPSTPGLDSDEPEVNLLRHPSPKSRSSRSRFHGDGRRPACTHAEMSDDRLTSTPLTRESTPSVPTLREKKHALLESRLRLLNEHYAKLKTEYAAMEVRQNQDSRHLEKVASEIHTINLATTENTKQIIDLQTSRQTLAHELAILKGTVGICQAELRNIRDIQPLQTQDIPCKMQDDGSTARTESQSRHRPRHMTLREYKNKCAQRYEDSLAEDPTRRPPLKRTNQGLVPRVENGSAETLAGVEAMRSSEQPVMAVQDDPQDTMQYDPPDLKPFPTYPVDPRFTAQIIKDRIRDKHDVLGNTLPSKSKERPPETFQVIGRKDKCSHMFGFKRRS